MSDFLLYYRDSEENGIELVVSYQSNNVAVVCSRQSMTDNKSFQRKIYYSMSNKWNRLTLKSVLYFSVSVRLLSKSPTWSRQAATNSASTFLYLKSSLLFIQISTLLNENQDELIASFCTFFFKRNTLHILHSTLLLIHITKLRTISHPL